MRDDFSVEVKRIAAARVGNRCSNPDCDKQTSGPQIDPAKALNVGVAAHITAAASGGPRYDSSLTTEERRSINNAIWLCQNCAKLVDNDPGRFSVDELRRWKDQAETTSLQRLVRPARPDGTKNYPTDPLSVDPDLERFVNYLKGNNSAAKLGEIEGRYPSRYKQKMDGRLEISLRVKENWDSEEAKIISEKFTENANEGQAVEVITRIFNEHGRLLIVGNPGSGKTVLLLKLAINLLHDIRVAKIEGGAIPVIFNLVTWSEEYKDFDDWLSAMLVSGYGLSRHFASDLLAKRKIIFLLDGLDELARNEPEDRAASIRAKCLSSLNEYVRENMKVVLCCRTEQFMKVRTLTGKDAPASAKVEVLDLTYDQVDSALREADRKELTHRAAARNLSERKNENKALAAVLQIPFFFNIAQTVFDREIFEKEVPTDFDTLKGWLLQEFVNAKLLELHKYHGYKAERAKAWLAWLAKLMGKKNLINFELSHLQSRDLRRVRLFTILCCTILSLYFYISSGSWHGILYMGFSIVLMIRKLDFRRSNRLEKRSLSGSFHLKILAYSLVGISIPSILLAIIFLFSILFIGFLGSVILVATLLLLYLPLLLCNSFCVGLWGALIEESDFKTEDRIQWELSKFLSFKTWRAIIFSGLKYGLACCAVFLLMFLMSQPVAGLAYILEYGEYIETAKSIGEEIENNYDPTYIWLYVAVGLALGFVFSVRDAAHKVRRFSYLERPYQRLKGGMVYDVVERIMLFMGLLSVMTFIEIRIQSEEDLLVVIVVGILFLIVGFLYPLAGGLLSTPLFNHYMLRLCLYFEGAMPLKYVTFLNYATKARILEKDGGQWRFRHQYLQDHFANRII